jgi:PHD/YefM family antitoxin component YafN of YafNO toxin-antitoxin module
MKEIRTVTAKWVRKHFKEVVDRVVNAGEHFMVEDDNTPAVVILYRSEYEHLKRQADLSRFFTANNHESELVTGSSRITEADRQAELRIIKQQVYGK